VHIFICRNCGKLTESENSDEKVCSSCGAPLDPVKPDSKEATQARQRAPGGAAPIRLPTAQQPTGQARPPQPSGGQARPPSPRPASTPPPTPPSTPASRAPARSTQPRPVELPANATPPPQAGRPPPRPVALPAGSTPPPTARAQLRTVELGAEEPETKSEEKPPAVAGETPTEETIIPTQSPVDAGTEGMEVYENKELVACPQCGYGCDPNWGKCPLCEAPISGTGDLKKVAEMDFTADESSFTKGLVPCPKCQYYCDPSWGTCPICNTELKKSETSEKPEKPE
jgi:rubrerythrin